MQKQILVSILLGAMAVMTGAAQTTPPAGARSRTFSNPVIPADFPDPDVAKMGDTYYFLSTTMCLMPGATVLKSNDLVDWEYCCNPLEKMSEADKYSLIGGQSSYAQGMWAGAIEEHDGKLYILLNCNDAGAFVLSTDDPEGQWEMKKLSRSYYDPGMIMENDRIYIVCGINHINICELDTDWNFIKETTVIRKDNTGLEGSHLYHIGDYYYIYSTYGGWPTGQTIFRSENITGPYTEKMLMEKWIDNKPNTVHQGALMETSTGQWWTLLMEDKGAIGRLPSLHPVKWEDGWPTLAKDGVPQMNYTKPNVGETYPEVSLVADDNFRNSQLGKQWQWNHNPPAGLWSLMERPGYLRLHTSSVTDDFMKARGTLTQRIFAKKLKTSPWGLDTSNPSVATVCIDVEGMKDGDIAGIAVQQDPYAQIGITKNAAGNFNLVWKSGSLTELDDFTPQSQTRGIALPEGQTKIYLRSKFNCGNSQATFFYSFDNQTWTQLGGATTLRFNLSVFVGARWAIYNYSTKAVGGHVDVDWFCTQDECDEAVIEPGEFEGYSDDMLTIESLTIGNGGDEYELMVGSERDIKLIATYANGRTEDVSGQATYTVDWPELVTVAGGRIKGNFEGKSRMKASYTDLLGNTKEIEVKVSASYFPFSAEFIKDVWNTNSYDPETRTFRTTNTGQIGWVYSTPIDMSAYKYLVLYLDAEQNCDADIRIYTENSIWGSAYIQKMGAGKRSVVRFKTLKYTDGDLKGQPVDLTNVCKVVFWSNGNGPIDVKDMYLTNNSDYSREESTGIEDVLFDRNPSATGVYDLSGRPVKNPHNGIYIVNGRKVYIK